MAQKKNTTNFTELHSGWMRCIKKVRMDGRVPWHDHYEEARHIWQL